MTTPKIREGPTPRTDKAIDNCPQFKNPPADQPEWIVDADFARQLERENQELREALQRLLDNYKANGGKGLGIGPIMKARAALGEGREFMKTAQTIFGMRVISVERMTNCAIISAPPRLGEPFTITNSDGFTFSGTVKHVREVPWQDWPTFEISIEKPAR